MAQMPDHDEQGRGHRVRPRWTWAALAIMVLGATLIAWGVLVLSWPWAIAGAVVLLLGMAVAGYGCLLYDVHTKLEIGAEIHDVVHGESHLGPDPMARVDDEEAKEIARQKAEELRRLQAPTATSKPRPSARRRGPR